MSNTRVDVTPFITEQEFPPLQHFINGAFVESAGEVYSEVVNPANGQVIALVPRGSTADVDDAVNAAHDAFRQWGSVTPKEGSEAMLAIANVVEESADLLARLEAHNAGKPLEVARDDVDGTVDIFRFSAGAAPRHQRLRKTWHPSSIGCQVFLLFNWPATSVRPAWFRSRTYQGGSSGCPTQ